MAEAPSGRKPAPVFVALDFSDAAEARELVRVLGERGTHYKVGLELYLSAGADFVRELVSEGKRVFLDLKFHDIPNTVRQASRAAARLGVDLFTAHALGGPAMVRAAAEGAAEGVLEGVLEGSAGRSGEPARVLAVTVLTSLSQDEAAAVGLASKTPGERAASLAAMASEAGAFGAVCSARDLGSVRRAAPGLRLLVPGIRPAGSAADDHALAADPVAAASEGADYLVIGRPITRSEDPRGVLERVQDSLLSAVRIDRGGA